ncbi:hypothetical protein OK074_0224 [Actinobacteria bacterium OK074]|nr:hypothetical protein OK074_0224 [Actinobacteria bacterium OK074]
MTAAARRGTTTVSVRAVRKVAERAAAEALPGRDGARPASAVASVRGGRAEVSLGVTLPYPAPLADTVRSVQRHVVERTGRLTGLDVPFARVDVTSLVPASSAHPPVRPADSPGAGTSGIRPPRRWWSQRRVPVAVLTAVAAAGCGALALDLVRTHVARHAAAAWRVSAVHWLSGHGPGDPSVTVGGGLTALAGIWLLVLALTPGRRRLLTVRTPTAHVGAAVDRSAVETLVADAVAAVGGVEAVRVRVRRRRVTVRAGLAFGDRAAARDAVTAAARDTLTACHLRHDPRLRIALAPQPVRQPPDRTADTAAATPRDGDGADPSGTAVTAPRTAPTADAPRDSASHHVYGLSESAAVPTSARAAGGDR